MFLRRMLKLNVKVRRNLLLILVIIVNTYVWLICTSFVLGQIIKMANLPNQGLCIIWTTNFLGAAASIFLGAYLAGRIRNRRLFLFSWIILGTVGSLASNFTTTFSFNEVLVVSILLNISFGFGLPVAMAEFSDNTAIECRAKLSGVVWFSVMLLSGLIMNFIGENLIINSLILTFWRTASLAVLFFYETNINMAKNYASIIEVVKNRSFILYLAPWTMFSLVNYLSVNVGINFFGEDFVSVLTLFSSFLAGVFAVFGGIISDTIGRRRTTILGFVLLGFGYALLGIFPQNTATWYFYALIDGITWGIFYVIFLFTIWGELAGHKSSENYYALGSLPHLLSTYLRLIIGSIIAENVSFYAIFSLTAFFLFLAVIPLMFAPETLPERVIRERELRSYIERAKRVRERFTKG